MENTKEALLFQTLSKILNVPVYEVDDDSSKENIPSRDSVNRFPPPSWHDRPPPTYPRRAYSLYPGYGLENRAARF
jgi:hypothetical protein